MTDRMEEGPNNPNTVRFEVPVLKEPVWTPTFKLLLVMAFMNAVAILGILIGGAQLFSLVDEQARQDDQIVQHRVRNEESHSALCNYMEAIIRRVGIDPSTLVNDGGEQVTCPNPLTPEQVRKIQHP